MTLIALVTGAIWGEPMWGTWWAWDPRLTSFLILFLFYLGYMALWAAIEDPDTAADLTSGAVPRRRRSLRCCSRYAVDFWSQGLHQGPSLTVAQKQHVADAFWYPLMISIAGFLAVLRDHGAAAHPHRDPAAAVAGAAGAGADGGMMPDLGKYAVAVLSAYGAAILLIAALVAVTLIAGRQGAARSGRGGSAAGTWQWLE